MQDAKYLLRATSMNLCVGIISSCTTTAKSGAISLANNRFRSSASVTGGMATGVIAGVHDPVLLVGPSSPMCTGVCKLGGVVTAAALLREL